MRALRNLLGPLATIASVFVVGGVLTGVAFGASEASPASAPPTFHAQTLSLSSAERVAHPTDHTRLRFRKTTEPTGRERRPAARPTFIVDIPGDLQITARPGGGEVIGTMPAGSRYFDEPLHAALLERTADGRFGRVPVPYSGTKTTGWIRLEGLTTNSTPYRVEADLSRHRITVKKLDEVIARFRAATGAAGSPTPTGDYFVTDRVAIPPGGSFGSFAFGLSGIQPNLPDGWSGGDQLAIHGTQDPSSIGTSASAGCLRVSEETLDRLKPLLQLGTPVTITS